MPFAPPRGSAITGPDVGEVDPLVGHVRVGGVVQEGRPAGGQHLLAERPVHGVGEVAVVVGCLAHRDGDPELVPAPGWEDHRHDVGVGELGDAFRHDLEAVVALGGEQLAGHVGGGLQPDLAALRLLVEPRVLDRHTRRRGERGDELLVLGREVSLGQGGEVEVPEHRVSDPDRDAEETAHGRMPLREAHGPGVVVNVAQTDGSGIVDQRSEESLALGQVPDGRDHVVVHADVDELLEATAVGGDDAQGAVRRVHEPAGGLDDPPQHRAQREVADDGEIRAQQPAQPVLILVHDCDPRVSDPGPHGSPC